ncbi:MAG: PilZ domain-containing protein [Myxococcota bacterium]|nr:PilZ domain-containing protein [Myxococcota bacterium]
MGRLARQRRVRCRLACEVLDCGRRPVRGVLCSLSAGGLSLEARLRVEQGDGIRLRILPHRRARAVTVGAIVWNDRPLRGAGRKGALRTIGCVVSDPPQAYLDLIAEVDECNGHAGPLPPSVRPAPDVDLLRSGEPPPAPKPLADEAPLSRPGAASSGPKPLADEALSSFRVRVKRVGGRRMRTFRTRMRTASAATDRVHAALGGTQGAWEVLDTVEETDRDIVKEIDGA